MALNFPSNPSDGDIYESYVWNATVGAWQAQAAEGGGSIEVSATAPANPSAGDLWWDPDNGNLYIYYDDGTSQQWVAANGPQVFVGTSAPAGYQGQLWFDSTEGKTYIYYDDGTSAQWVSAIGGSLSGNVIQVVSTTKTDTFSASIAAYSYSSDIPSLTASITPKSTSSKILVSVNIAGSRATGSYPIFMYTLNRDGTSIAIGDASGSRSRITNGALIVATDNSAMTGLSSNFLDSPATTSSITYSVKLFNNGGSTQTYGVNRTPGDDDAGYTLRPISTITLMEIAG